jgi:hypothetical protein
MAADLAALKQGIKARLATIPGLSAYAIEPANPKHPAAWPVLRTIDYGTTFDGGTNYHFAISVEVAAGNLELAQKILHGYVDQVAAAFDGDPTLGGVADSAYIGEFLGITDRSKGDERRAIGGQWTLEVLG